MQQLLACLFIVLILLMIPSPRPTLAVTKSHPQRLLRMKADESCVSCHTNLKHDGRSGLFTSQCAACHAGNAPATLLNTAISGAEPALTENTSQTSNGMQGEQYYSPSRLGSEPNPMTLIPAGDFIMGTDDRLSDEGPQHSRYLPDFYIDQYEVTNLQYQQFNDATNRKSPTHFRNRTFPEGKADHPVTYVSWHDAEAYCQWAGKRLPTDAEWEKAARGPHGLTYPWGNEFDINKANTPLRWESLQQEGDTTPVGAFAAGASPYGVQDMAGNVWEWTASWYQAYPGNTQASENYGETYKVLKGGSWWDCSFYKCGISAPSYNRSFFLQHTRNKSFGFRCARDAGAANPNEISGRLQ